MIDVTGETPQLIEFTELQYDSSCFVRDVSISNNWETFRAFGRDADGKLLCIVVPATTVCRQITIAMTGGE